jgi:hypothetical protein
MAGMPDARRDHPGTAGHRVRVQRRHVREVRPGRLACPELAEDLLAGLAELIHPHGTVDSAGSVGHYVAVVRHMTRHLAAAGYTGGAAGLRRAQAARYWMAAPGPKEACTRRMLHGFQTAGGTLDARLAELASGRAFNPQRNHRQLPPYSETEWERLASACQSVAGESFVAHKKALAAAGRSRHPRGQPRPVPGPGHGDRLPAAVRHLLGIVPDGIDDLVTGDIDWAGDSVILLSYVKGRAAAESLNLPRRAVRLLEQWLSRSALLRSHADPEHRRDLWLRLNKPGGTRIWAEGGAAGRVAVQRWIARHGVAGDDGRR